MNHYGILALEINSYCFGTRIDDAFSSGLYWDDKHDTTILDIVQLCDRSVWQIPNDALMRRVEEQQWQSQQLPYGITYPWTFCDPTNPFASRLNHLLTAPMINDFININGIDILINGSPRTWTHIAYTLTATLINRWRRQRRFFYACLHVWMYVCVCGCVCVCVYVCLLAIKFQVHHHGCVYLRSHVNDVNSTHNMCVWFQSYNINKYICIFYGWSARFHRTCTRIDGAYIHGCNCGAYW